MTIIGLPPPGCQTSVCFERAARAASAPPLRQSAEGSTFGCMSSIGWPL